MQSPIKRSTLAASLRDGTLTVSTAITGSLRICAVSSRSLPTANSSDTEKYALKGADRFKEKLAKRIALEPDKSADELAAEIHDGIRYTFIFPTDKYTAGVYDAEGKLRRRGHELRQRKPSWGDGQYKGVNSRWQDPRSRQLFEVQFHTPESWEAKQRTHDAYATIENPAASEVEKAAARKYQQDVSAGIPIPDGAHDIPPYKDEGR